jgi:hypothetical protein
MEGIGIAVQAVAAAKEKAPFTAGHRLIFTLDTGAGRTVLYAGFRNQFAELVNAAGRKASGGAEGASGIVEHDVLVLPWLNLGVGGFETLLRPAAIEPKEDLGWGHHGNFGLDLLNQARVVTIDFRAMRLTLEGRRPAAR